MDGIREIFSIKLQREFLQFKESMLKQDKSGLFAACYVIDIHRNLYEILCEMARKIPEQILETAYRKSNLLEWLYGSWLKAEDSYYKELKAHVEKEILQFQPWIQEKEDETVGRNEECKAADSSGD